MNIRTPRKVFETVDKNGQTKLFVIDSVGDVVILTPTSSPPRPNAIAWSGAVEAKAREYAGMVANNHRLKAEDREDFLQDCLAKAYQKIKERKIEHVSALYRMFWNLAIDRTRRINRRIQPLSMEAHGFADPESDLSGEAEPLRWAREAMPEFVDAVERIGDGESWGSVAKSYGLTIDELRRAVAKGQKMMREKFGVLE